MTPTNDVIVALFIGSSVSLIIKIVWDWLKDRRNPPPVIKNPLCNLHDLAIIRIDSCLTHVKDHTIKLSEQIGFHSMLLDEGKKDFGKMKTDIAEICTNVGILLDRSNKRRETDD